jgi:hypothetical protein
MNPRQHILERLAQPYQLTPNQALSLHLINDQWLARFSVDAFSCDLPLQAQVDDYLGAEAEALELATDNLIPIVSNPDFSEAVVYRDQHRWLLAHPCIEDHCSGFSLPLTVPRVPFQLRSLLSTEDAAACQRLEPARARAIGESSVAFLAAMQHCPHCLSEGFRAIELVPERPALWFDTTEQRWQLWTPNEIGGLSFPLDVDGFLQPLAALERAAQAIDPEFRIND